MNLSLQHIVFLGLGSNLGDREDNIRHALAWLDAHPDIELVVCSKLKETLPWGVEDQPRFINAAVKIKTVLSPHVLLSELKAAEIALGREPNGLRWGPRIIDLDILLFDEEIVVSKTLTIPHPRLTERDFVMEQIVELDETARHPAVGCTISSLLK